MFTVSNKFVRIGCGCDVTIFGVGFDPTCKIYFENDTVSPLDVTEDAITFSAPKQLGTYKFQIRNSTVASPECTLCVVPVSESVTWLAPVRGTEEFLNMFLGLLPRGFGWNVIKGTNFYKFFDAVASALLFIYNYFAAIVKQGSPVKTTDFATWENELGLPKKGLKQTTDEGRLKEIYRISRQRGGCTVPHFKQLLDLYGADYELYEYWDTPSVFPDWVAALGDMANFYVLVKVYKDKISYGFTCTSNCNDSLDNDRDTILESILNYDKPAHVQIIYEYFVRVLTDDNGEALTDDDGKLLIV